jgi:dTDP-4-amino-4,6-dideoxygalactose transaminase
VRHAIGVGNGMDALEIALRALGVGAGDEVVTTAMTAFPSVLAIIRAGAEPVLADIDPATAQLDPASVERCLGPRVRAVMPVHLYGLATGLARWRELCAAHRLHLVEDCAQSHGAREGNLVAGAAGVAGGYSFYPTKNLGARGDAGLVVTDRDDLAAAMRRLRNYGQSDRYHHPMLGLNSRLDELQAALLSARLPWLDAFTARRREIAAAYHARIRNPRLVLPAEPADPAAHVHHLFVLRCAERERLYAHLAARGIASLAHYPLPVHHQEPCRQARRDPAGLAHAERHAAECCTIPCHPQMSEGEVERVVEALNGFS